MRLFLASNDLGEFPEELVRLVKGNRIALVITNARDHRKPEDRKKIVKKMLEMLADNGFEPEELDLRLFFGKASELRSHIEEKRPGLVFLMGGNFYSLATALKLSKMREIIREDIAKDKYVYGGYSAGAINAAKDLNLYSNTYGKNQNDRKEQAKNLYGEVSTEGLGLIDGYICPHTDVERYKMVARNTIRELENSGKTVISLNDADVYIVNGEESKILRGRS